MKPHHGEGGRGKKRKKNEKAGKKINIFSFPHLPHLSLSSPKLLQLRIRLLFGRLALLLGFFLDTLLLRLSLLQLSRRSFSRQLLVLLGLLLFSGGFLLSQFVLLLSLEECLLSRFPLSLSLRMTAYIYIVYIYERIIFFVAF